MADRRCANMCSLVEIEGSSPTSREVCRSGMMDLDTECKILLMMD